jgi:hypothetical protein
LLWDSIEDRGDDLSELVPFLLFGMEASFPCGGRTIVTSAALVTVESPFHCDPALQVYSVVRVHFDALPVSLGE